MNLYQRAHLRPVADIAKYEVKSSLVQWADVSLDLFYKSTELRGSLRQTTLTNLYNF